MFRANLLGCRCVHRIEQGDAGPEEEDMAAPLTIQAFGGPADDVRQHGPSAEALEARVPASQPAAILTFGNYGLTDVDLAIRGRRGVAVPVSVGLHAGAAVALALVPLLLASTLPNPAKDIRAFFVEPLSALPASPPPPPPAARAAVAARVAPRAAAVPAGFVAPIEVPAEIRPEEGLDLGGVEGGVAGGVEGGVPGGMVGGIVGGLPDAPPPPAVTPVRVGGDVREPRKVLDVAPVYPDLALKAHVEGIVIIEATVDVRGHVVDAEVLRSVPMLDEAALEAVRKWVYTPTLLSGIPTPVVMTVTVNFSLRHRR
jgi:protein TonB